MAGPTQLKDSETDGPLQIDHGDPNGIIVIVPWDASGHSYRADIRKNTRDDSEVLASWDVTAIYNPSTQKSTITMLLPGDSAIGAKDGRSRKVLPGGCVTDLQELDTNGVPTRTLIRADLVGVRDVTR